MQIYFHRQLFSHLSRVPILVEGTVYIYMYIRGGTVQLFHGSVCITVLESRFPYGSVCLGKNYTSLSDLGVLFTTPNVSQI